MGWSSADDPAYVHELEQLAELCRSFLEQFEQGDFDGCLFDTGRITASCAMIYQLSLPAGLLDPATLFSREEPSA